MHHPPPGRRASLPEPTSSAFGGLRSPSPDTMTPAARRAEAATILAAGFLRLRLNQTKKREIPLDVLPRPSDECLEPAGGGQAQVRGRETVSESIVKQIAGLHRLAGPQLKERWRELYGTEPPGYNRTFLIKRLASRLQELTHGGLSDDAGRLSAAPLRCDRRCASGRCGR